MTAPILVFAIGNESRGDDALAPLLVRRMQDLNNAEVEIIEDYQLQVEHVTDLVGRHAVVFIDADVSCEAPFHFSKITDAHDNSYTSHAMSPFAVLHAYRNVYVTDAPSSFLLRIRGYGFDLGESLSPRAALNLELALVHLRQVLARLEPDDWIAFCKSGRTINRE